MEKGSLKVMVVILVVLVAANASHGIREWRKVSTDSTQVNGNNQCKVNSDCISFCANSKSPCPPGKHHTPDRSICYWGACLCLCG
ncbi:hypothetical protein RJT34_13930 [Clitoria ternatea]|uniref:Uncharacterized protein n=1 Tax=Clitoria ternatea TaxID=43366 RepID=A0AAN9JRZ4_CLITE